MPPRQIKFYEVIRLLSYTRTTKIFYKNYEVQSQPLNAISACVNRKHYCFDHMHMSILHGWRDWFLHKIVKRQLIPCRFTYNPRTTFNERGPTRMYKECYIQCCVLAVFVVVHRICLSFSFAYLWPLFCTERPCLIYANIPSFTQAIFIVHKRVMSLLTPSTPLTLRVSHEQMSFHCCLELTVKLMMQNQLEHRRLRYRPVWHTQLFEFFQHFAPQCRQCSVSKNWLQTDKCLTLTTNRIMKTVLCLRILVGNETGLHRYRRRRSNWGSVSSIYWIARVLIPMLTSVILRLGERISS